MKLLAVVSCILLGANGLAPQGGSLGNCASLAECMAAFDRINYEGRILEDLDQVRDRLETFGEPAKVALFSRINPEPDSIDEYLASALAGDILGAWRDIAASDVDRIREIGPTDSGYSLMEILARLKTAEALATLVDFTITPLVDEQGPVEERFLGNYPQIAAQAGPEIIPHVVAAMDRDVYRQTPYIFEELQSPALADQWLQLARTGSETQRIAALAGLATVSDASERERISRALRYMVEEEIPDIRETAILTMIELDDYSAIDAYAQLCVRRQGSGDWRYSSCVLEIAKAGDRAAAQHLIPLIDSDSIEAIGTLGHLGVLEAAPQLVAALQSSDWRVVYSSARSLGWLEDDRAVEGLGNVARHHWLPEVRQAARRSLAAIEDGQTLARARPRPSGFPALSVNQFSDISTAPAACSMESMRWKGQRLPPPSPRVSDSLSIGGGRFELRGLGGEFSGSLVWIKGGEEKTVFSSRNVSLTPAPGGQIVMSAGLAHGGLDGGGLYRMEPSNDSWVVTSIGTVTGAPSEPIPFEGLFVAYSGPYAIIFSPESILGVAECAA